MPEARIPLVPRWTSHHPCPAGYVGRLTLNMNTRAGRLDKDQGFRLHRRYGSTTSKLGATFLHTHTDGVEYPGVVYSTIAYDEEANSLRSGLAENALWSFAHFPQPTGITIGVNGTDKVLWRRSAADNTTLVAVSLEIGVPTIPTPPTGSAAGGSLANGFYTIRAAFIDDAGAVVAESDLSAAAEGQIELTGGNTRIVVAEPTGQDARVTKIRFYVSYSASAYDTALSSLFLEKTVTQGTGPYNIDTIGNSSTIPSSRNGVVRQATIPLDAAPVCVVQHDSDESGEGGGRAVFAYGNEIAWSENDSQNHFYSTNVKSVGSSNIVALASVAGILYVFTRTQIWAVHGDFGRDDVGDSPTYAAKVTPRLIASNIGALSKSVCVFGNAAYFMSSQGPAVLSGGLPRPLMLVDIEPEMRTWDPDYAARVVIAWDPHTRHVCFLVPRETNASRPLDGASVAGLADRLYRWNIEIGAWAPPMAIDAVWIATHALYDTSGGVSGGHEVTFVALGIHGSVLEVGRYGWNGGLGVTDVSGATFDGILATANTTTSATFARTAGTTDDLKGYTITLYYPIVDTGYSGWFVQKTISGNTYSGGNVVISWVGAITVPTSTKWTCRIGGLQEVVEPPDLAEGLLQPGELMEFRDADLHDNDLIGAEAIS